MPAFFARYSTLSAHKRFRENGLRLRLNNLPLELPPPSPKSRLSF